MPSTLPKMFQPVTRNTLIFSSPVPMAHGPLHIKVTQAKKNFQNENLKIF